MSKKTKEKKAEPKFHYEIVINQEQTGYREEGDTTQRYGGYRETTYHNTMDTIINAWPKDKYPSFSCDVDIKVGNTAFVVWVEYTSGGTGSRSIRGYTNIIGLFTHQDYKSAVELKDAVENSNSKSERLKLTTSDGQHFDIYKDWEGYFERIEKVYITPVIRGI